MKALLLPFAVAWTAFVISASAEVIGVEQFDYPDGVLAGQNGGTFWDYKNTAPAGHTGPASTWDAVTGNAAFMDEYFALVRRAGAEPLAVGETGYRQISNSKHPIVKPDDLKGIKVRVVGSPMYGDIMSSMGANPTFMSWADAQPALASGAVDAQENPLEVFLAAKIHTLGQKYVTKWNYSNDILLFAIATPIWQSWNAADQKIVREAAIDAAKQQVQLVRKLFDEDVQRVSALGVQVHVPTPPEIAAWQIATRRTYASWKAQIHPGLIGKAEEIVAKTRKA